MQSRGKNLRKRQLGSPKIQVMFRKFSPDPPSLLPAFLSKNPLLQSNFGQLDPVLGIVGARKHAHERACLRAIFISL